MHMFKLQIKLITNFTGFARIRSYESIYIAIRSYESIYMVLACICQ